MLYTSFFSLFLVLFVVSDTSQQIPADVIQQYNERFLTSSGGVLRPYDRADVGDSNSPDYNQRMGPPREDGRDVEDFENVKPYWQNVEFEDAAELCLQRPQDQESICIDDPLYDWKCRAPWNLCGTSCNNQFICLCDKDIEDNSVCWQDNYCSRVTRCNKNSQCKSNEVCVPDTCCPPTKEYEGICLDLCEDPDLPTPTPRPTTWTRSPTPKTRSPQPAPNDNECPCENDEFWSCQPPGAWTPPERCGRAEDGRWGCYCVPQDNQWQPGNPEDNSCVENNWCSAAPICNTDDDCPVDYECIPNTCCSPYPSRCVRCCGNPNQPTPRPTQATRRPTDRTRRPTDATRRPTDATRRPTDVTRRPTDKTRRPTDATRRPTDVTRRPTDATPSPVREPSNECPCDNPSKCYGPFMWQNRCINNIWTVFDEQIQTEYRVSCFCANEEVDSTDPTTNPDLGVCINGVFNTEVGLNLCNRLTQFPTCTTTADCEKRGLTDYNCVDACCPNTRNPRRCVPCCTDQFPY